MGDELETVELVDVGWPRAEVEPWGPDHVKYTGALSPRGPCMVEAILDRAYARPLYVKRELRGQLVIFSLIDDDEVICGQSVFDLAAFG
jgi:hypothetical protein